MPDPIVVTRLRQFKASLLARDARESLVMGQRWLQVEQALADKVNALAQDIHDRGGLVSADEFSRLERAQDLLAQAQAEFGKYADFTTDLVTAEQRTRIELALRHSQQAIELAAWPRVGQQFNRLNARAVENMAGLAGNGQPIGALLKERMVRDAAGKPLPEVWDRLTRTLIDATARGVNPRTTARLMAADLEAGRAKAETIAITEQARVYRMATVQSYRESGVVRAYRRMAAHDVRTCLGCLALDGELFSLAAELSDHPNGRCTAVPVLTDGPDMKFTTGEQWFNTLNESGQRALMGPYYEPWSKGEFWFRELGTHTFDETWGGGVAVTPLESLGISKAA